MGISSSYYYQFKKVADEIANLEFITEPAGTSSSAIASLKQESNPFPQYKKPHRSAEPPVNPELYEVFEEVRNGQFTSWYWNGSLWFSTTLYEIIGLNGLTLAASAGGSGNSILIKDKDIFVEKTITIGYINGLHDTSNFWYLGWRGRKKSDRATTNLFITFSYEHQLVFSSTPAQSIETNYNTLVSAGTYLSLMPVIVKSGTPANLEHYGINLFIRYVRP